MSVKKSSPAISPVMRQVSGYIATALRRPLPAPVVEKTKHHILDTLAAMVSGTKLLPGKMAISYVKTLGGNPQAQVVGTRVITNAVNAAVARLNVNRVRHVLSYTAQQTGGLSTYMRDVDHIEKAWDFGGMPARNGVAAATMVAAGCTAVEDVFSGERNFYAAFDESRRIGRYPAPATLAPELGRNFEIMRTNIKRWSVGSPIQAPLDSLLELIRAHNVKADDVEKLVIRVSINGANTVNNRQMPDICMQQMCAVMLLDGIVTFESAHDEKRMRDPAVLALRQRIELVGDAELEALIPERHGIAELTLKDGRQLRHHTEAVRGTAQNPITHAEVDEKCYHLMAPVLGKKRARTLCDTIWALEKIKDARKLRPLLKS